MTAAVGKLVKVVWGGKFYTDEWACSVHMAAIDAGSPVNFNVDDLKPALLDWFTRVNSYTSSKATLEFVKANEVDKVTGRYVDGSNPRTALFPPGVVGSSSAGAQPSQLSTCITMHTDLVRGRASHGRFYPPGGFPGLGVDGRMPANFVKDMADSAQELLSELNAVTGFAGAWRVVVWSQIGQTAQTAERVSVGRVVDTQRRRRSSLDEDPQFATANI